MGGYDGRGSKRETGEKGMRERLEDEKGDKRKETGGQSR